MLVLGRKEGEVIQIGENIVITVTEIRENSVRIGIQAPREIAVRRQPKAKTVKRSAKSSPEASQLPAAE